MKMGGDGRAGARRSQGAWHCRVCRAGAPGTAPGLCRRSRGVPSWGSALPGGPSWCSRDSTGTASALPGVPSWCSRDSTGTASALPGVPSWGSRNSTGTASALPGGESRAQDGSVAAAGTAELQADAQARQEDHHQRRDHSEAERSPLYRMASCFKAGTIADRRLGAGSARPAVFGGAAKRPTRR